MLDTGELATYVARKRSLYREYSRSYEEDRRRFVTAGALTSRIDWALGNCDAGQWLLDLGCGTGDLLLEAFWRTQGRARLVGMDLTLEMLALARARVEGNADLIEGNVLDGLPFGAETFDIITSLNLVQELPSPGVNPFLMDVHRVLRPGGTFRAVIPCMTARNPASKAFRDICAHSGGMEFHFGEDLEALLTATSSFSKVEIRTVPSPAASAAAGGKTRFKFFTDVLDQVKERGLDPNQVSQSVVFLALKRET